VNLAPAQFEAMFLSAAHKKEELENVLDIVETYFQSYQKA
jgi:glutamate-1-semialdehyde aminotransferase